jgi:hypothetical protein
MGKTMGMWDVTAFGNDAAADWVLELQDTDQPTALLESEFLRAILGTYLELEVCQRVIAGASIVVAAATGYAEGVPADTLKWIEGREAQLISVHSLAEAALVKVGEGSSELSELLLGGDAYDAWCESLDKLLATLRSLSTREGR